MWMPRRSAAYTPPAGTRPTTTSSARPRSSGCRPVAWQSCGRTGRPRAPSTACRPRSSTARSSASSAPVPARDDDAPRARELYFIYLLDAFHGTGIGQKLFDAAVEENEPLYLWVADDNPRAHRFYTRNGFTADGASHVEPFLGESLTEVRFVR